MSQTQIRRERQTQQTDETAEELPAHVVDEDVEQLKSDTDALLDEIDNILAEMGADTEATAQEFVAGFKQERGQ